ncbi:MAG TPA: DUF3604 domain-containing protein [Thiotrichaceae bacterium]|nr:DUF3604 domain-containing protein [Thiotrichaceae bacterium]
MINKFNLKMAIRAALLGGSVLLACTQTAFATDSPSSTCELDPNDPPYNFYFGDLHIHTVRSLDSYMYNNANTPEDAYRFAKGEKLPIGDSEVNVKITRPLDFAAVTDHAENMAEYHLCVENESSPVFDTKSCQRLRDRDMMLFAEMNSEMQEPDPKHNEEVCPVDEGGESEICRNASMTRWDEYKIVANAH